jgi:rhamnosyl/mannosyltransferase
MVPYKGLSVALQALQQSEGLLWMVGDGPLRRSLEREAQQLGISERVIVVGEQNSPLDLVPYYLAADALWFPSLTRAEAFGLVQVEAMASGCPVINTSIPASGVPWVSRHDQEGLTVPVNDPVALADAARRLMQEPALRDRLAKAGRRRAEEVFSARRMARDSVEIYRQVLAA